MGQYQIPHLGPGQGLAFQKRPGNGLNQSPVFPQEADSQCLGIVQPDTHALIHQGLGRTQEGSFVRLWRATQADLLVQTTGHGEMGQGIGLLQVTPVAVVHHPSLGSCLGPRQNSLGRHILAFSAEAFGAARKQLSGADTLSEAQQFAIDFFCFGSLGMIQRWLFRDCNPDPRQMAALLVAAMPEELRQLYLPESELSASAQGGK